MSIFIQKFNNSFLKLTGDIEDLQKISEEFSLFAKNFRHTPLYKTGRWDGKIRFFNKSSGQLPYGLYKILFDFLIKSTTHFTISDELKKELLPSPLIIDLNEIINTIQLKNFENRNYQIDGIKKILTIRRGLLEHGTGAGKTVTMYIVLNYLLKLGLKKLIYIVPTTSLLKQTSNDFKEYGFLNELVGHYYGPEKDDSKIITVGTWQSLSKNIKLLEQVDGVICDEVHHGRAKEISELMKKCINATYRIGVTGSLPDWDTDQYSIIGSFGPLVHAINTFTLIHQEKVLTPAKVKIFNLHYPKELKKLAKTYPEERDIIEHYDIRKQLVYNLILNKCSKQNTLVLFDEISLGKKYLEYIKPKIDEATFYWISGKIAGEERENIRILTNEGNHVILFGSLGTVSTGINIPKLHNVIFLFIGKSLIRIKQSIGRGLRKHEDKELTTIYDIADDLKYSKKHLIERIKIYSKEGYPVEIFEIGGNK